MRWALQVRVSSALVRKVQGVGWNLSNNKRTLTNTFLTPCSRGADRVREREGDFACSHSFVWLHLSKQAVRRLTFVVTPSSASSALPAAAAKEKKSTWHLPKGDEFKWNKAPAADNASNLTRASLLRTQTFGHTKTDFLLPSTPNALLTFKNTSHFVHFTPLWFISLGRSFAARRHFDSAPCAGKFSG